MSNQQQQQRQRQDTQQGEQRSQASSIQDEYLATRRMAAETVEIGRATIDQATRQTEQLNHADRLADHNRYILDKSARLLRGMTWSGWIANKFSKDVEVGDYVRDTDTAAGAGLGKGNSIIPPSSEEYAELPSKFQPAAQAVINYRCNLAVLAQCQTPEQRTACGATCDELSNNVRRELRKLNGLDMDGNDRVAYDQLVKDLGEAEEIRRSLMASLSSSVSSSSNQTNRRRQQQQPLTPQNSLSASFASSSNNNNPKPSATTIHLQEQDEHLNALSQNLSELQGIGQALNTTFNEQNTLLDSLHDKSDSLTEQTKAVRRKAERITNRAKWIKIRPELTAWITIRHVKSGLYLCVGGDGAIKLGGYGGVDNRAAIFGRWQRKESSVVGLQNKLTRNYLGQTVLGYLACSSSKYGKAEEWEIDIDNLDDEGRDTAIMCVGANWGNGGWLEVNTRDGSVSIGGYGMEAKKKAAMWRITVLEEDEED